jgi:hypothetical protein
MKIKIGGYKSYFGPHQLAELLCFWVKEVPDEYGFKRKPDWVHDFGEWLAHGSVKPDDEVGDKVRLLECADRKNTWLYRFLLWIDKHRPERVMKIQIDPWDTWSMDHTLAMIIVPMLKQLKEKTHGAPNMDDADVPDHLKSTAAPPKENEWDTDDNHFKRWDWALSEMIWAFEHIVDDDWESEFHTGVSDVYFEKLEDGNYEMKRSDQDTSHFDVDGYTAASNRIKNGTRLFGKYFQNLWD